MVAILSKYINDAILIILLTLRQAMHSSYNTKLSAKHDSYISDQASIV